MKKTAAFVLALSAITSCSSSPPAPGARFPKPGAIVAQAREPIAEDPLNHFTFSVIVFADSFVTSGIYDVVADYGPNNAVSKLTLPKGCEDAQLFIRKGAAPYTYIIGFKLARDTTSHDYFEVSSTRNATNMRYIKAYSY